MVGEGGVEHERPEVVARTQRVKVAVAVESKNVPVAGRDGSPQQCHQLVTLRRTGELAESNHSQYHGRRVLPRRALRQGGRNARRQPSYAGKTADNWLCSINPVCGAHESRRRSRVRIGFTRHRSLTSSQRHRDRRAFDGREKSALDDTSGGPALIQSQAGCRPRFFRVSPARSPGVYSLQQTYR